MTSSSIPKFLKMRAACGMVSFLKSAAVPGVTGFLVVLLDEVLPAAVVS